MDLFGMANELKQLKADIASNPMAAVKARQVGAKNEELETQVRYLSAKVHVLEAILGQVSQIPEDKLQGIIEKAMVEYLRPRTIDEMARETVKCPACSRPVNKNLKACQICGQSIR
jgi:hypothetical protein